ncbi:MAG: TauD/TfdA family dioxygenase [Gammaproteobacteria bacterium]
MNDTSHVTGSGRAGGRATRRPIPLDSRRLVEFAPLVPGAMLPIVARPLVSELALPEWMERNRDECNRHLLAHGALLFRGFRPVSTEEFERLLCAFSGELMHYTYGSTPRQVVAGRIYTSTEYPADQSIPLHNEMAYARRWPMVLGLACMITPTWGGETPIADSRRILARIPTKIRERFARTGVMYVRTYGAGLDLSWQSTFQTDDRTQVEAFCRAGGIEYEWIGADGLRTRQVCQGIATHPRTGEPVWFNQAHLFHASNLDPGTRALLAEDVGPDALTRDALHGDGTPIDTAELEAIRAVLRAEAVHFSWSRGDVLLLDNMLVAHGRQPFRGSRRIVVGMNQPHGDPNG